MADQAKPIRKSWGNIKYDNMVDILKNRKNMITEWTDKNGVKHKQIAVKAAEWEGGNITIQAWDKEKKESINLIYLKPDTDGSAPAQAPSNNKQIEQEEDDFPF